MADLTIILENWSGETPHRRNMVFEALYDTLRSLAARQLRHERPGQVLEPTVLVHEAYFKLVSLDRMDIRSRVHFLGLAGRMMREILVDEARHARARKRDEGLLTRLTGELPGTAPPLVDLLDLEKVLVELGRIDEDYVWLVEARLFAGMTIDEAALGLGVSPATLKRKWRVARAFIAARVGGRQG